ncbi:MAG: glucosamine-6-phosphate deaminase [Terrimicrobiaceae bacterium]|nr:glucosamine-6-phosphate deaminase [Terrimicrobiaceae bacterium]
MEVIILQEPSDVTLAAALRIRRVMMAKADAVLGLATGSSPVGIYRELIRLHREEALDFSKVTTFNLDEYIGLTPQHPASYRHFMQEMLFDHVNIDPKRTFVPSGLVPGAEMDAYCLRYEEEIANAGGIDLQILGIGSDGHIGFNEPGSSLASRTRIKTLTQRTRNDNARYFSAPEDVPHHVVTMGIGTIMDAREIILIALGESKASAVASAVEGPVTATCPASILQMHPRTKIIVDEAAAIHLQRRDYYRWVFEQKPAWQKDDCGFAATGGDAP